MRQFGSRLSRRIWIRASLSPTLDITRRGDANCCGSMLCESVAVDGNSLYYGQKVKSLPANQLPLACPLSGVVQMEVVRLWSAASDPNLATLLPALEGPESGL